MFFSLLVYPLRIYPYIRMIEVQAPNMSYVKGAYFLQVWLSFPLIDVVMATSAT